MPQITQPAPREIIEDFAREIKAKSQEGTAPSVAVINFREEVQNKKERPVVSVPLALLRFRKDNGRIASDVMNYEVNIGPLDEKSDETQSILARFLLEKDREKTVELQKLLIHDGQREPAIITCDGFLINGNRRKLALQTIHEKDPSATGYMKVVILPGIGDPGGPPSLLEIEQIENRYQLQSDGKAEYSNFDKAISMRRKIGIGMDLRQQLLDDPQFSGIPAAKLSTAIRTAEDEYLKPLECVDRYLKLHGREKQYFTISTGAQGRWQAFVDYYKAYKSQFCNPAWINKHGIEEEEIGKIEVAAFHVIRLRDVPGMDKLHYVMRDLPKYCTTKDGKKAVLAIADLVKPLANSEIVNESNRPLKTEEVDAKWEAKNKRDITWKLKEAKESYVTKKEAETPIELLDAAFKKLTHENFDIESIKASDNERALKLAQQIRDRADEIKSQIYSHKKALDKLSGK